MSLSACGCALIFASTFVLFGGIKTNVSRAIKVRGESAKRYQNVATHSILNSITIVTFLTDVKFLVLSLTRSDFLHRSTHLSVHETIDGGKFDGEDD